VPEPAEYVEAIAVGLTGRGVPKEEIEWTPSVRKLRPSIGTLDRAEVGGQRHTRGRCNRRPSDIARCPGRVHLPIAGRAPGLSKIGVKHIHAESTRVDKGECAV
jgi:hypothetical protein